MYMAAFFETKEEAQDFIKQNDGGVLGSNVKGSRKKEEYHEALAIAGFPKNHPEKYPYSVTWRDWGTEGEA